MNLTKLPVSLCQGGEIGIFTHFFILKSIHPLFYQINYPYHYEKKLYSYTVIGFGLLYG